MVKLVNRARMSTSTTGTGTITLGSAENGYQSFDDAGVPDGDVVRYVIEDGANWEVGTGTYTASGTTLTRTVTESSNSDAAINLSGSAVVFIGPAAQDFSPTITLAGDASGSVTLTDLEDATLTVTVADDSHNHVIANVDGLQADLDAKLDKSGGTMTGNLILNADPTTALGAATKEYVDTIAAAGIHYHDPVRVEQEGNLTATYDNGSSGVGATLTNSGTQAALVIDGVTMVLNDRVLIYEQTNAFENGIYTVTNVGSASTNWVLTRATDADSYGASDPDALGQGDAFFVQEGNAGAGELYVMNTEGTITFGTTGITFTQIQSTAVYSGGTGITLSGTTFNLDSTIASDTTGNAATATALETARTIGGVSFDGTANINLAGVNTTGNQDTTGNAATATAWETARTVTLSGDVSGTATGVDGSGNISITTTVADDSHAHVISNVDGLQTALDAKAPTASPTFSGTVTFPAGQTFDGRDVSADGSKLDGIESGADVTDATNVSGAGALMRSGGQMTGNITMSGSQTVDGRDLSADGAKLDGIESGATADQTASEILTAIKTVDGSGSGLDADTVDGIQASSFLRSDAADTATGNLTLNGTVTFGSALDINGQYLDNVEDIYLRDKLFHDGDVDTYLGFGTNTITLATGGSSEITVDTTGVRLGDSGNGYFQPVTGSYGSIQIDGGAHTGYEGYNIGGRAAFIHDNANATGIYDDVNNQWLFYGGHGGSSYMYYDGVYKINTGSTGVNIQGDLNAVDNVYVADNIYHEGDTDTNINFQNNLIYFTAGNNSTLTVAGTYAQFTAPLYNYSIYYEDYDSLSGTSVTVNCDTAQAFSLTMTGNTTFTFNSVSNAWSTGFVLELTGNGGTVTWPTSVDWAGGTKPDAPASGETDLYVFWTRDGGTTWYGMLAIDAAA